MSVVDSTVAHRFRTVAPTTFKPYPDTIIESPVTPVSSEKLKAILRSLSV